MVHYFRQDFYLPKCLFFYCHSFELYFIFYFFNFEIVNFFPSEQNDFICIEGRCASFIKILVCFHNIYWEWEIRILMFQVHTHLTSDVVFTT